MKLLVLSDSHGHEETLANIISKHEDADVIIFLGDGERDFDAALAECNIAPFGSRKIDCYQVKGNCDIFSREAVTIACRYGGVSFLVTHGFDQNVKMGYWNLIDEAKSKMCTAALFGHTHVKTFMEKEGITLINPGSVAYGDYAFLEVNEGKITQLV